jgi:hypothetical protein
MPVTDYRWSRARTRTYRTSLSWEPTDDPYLDGNYIFYSNFVSNSAPTTSNQFNIEVTGGTHSSYSWSCSGTVTVALPQVLMRRLSGTTFNFSSLYNRWGLIDNTTYISDSCPVALPPAGIAYTASTAPSRIFSFNWLRFDVATLNGKEYKVLVNENDATIYAVQAEPVYLPDTTWFSPISTSFEPIPRVWLMICGGNKPEVLYKPGTKTFDLTINASNGDTFTRTITVTTSNYGVTNDPIPLPIDPNQPWGGNMKINGNDVYLSLIDEPTWESKDSVDGDWVAADLGTADCNAIDNSLNTEGRISYTMDLEIVSAEKGYSGRMDSESSYYEVFLDTANSGNVPSCTYDTVPVEGDEEYPYGPGGNLFLKAYIGAPALLNDEISIIPTECTVCTDVPSDWNFFISQSVGGLVIGNQITSTYNLTVEDFPYLCYINPPSSRPEFDLLITSTDGVTVTTIYNGAVASCPTSFELKANSTSITVVATVRDALPVGPIIFFTMRIYPVNSSFALNPDPTNRIYPIDCPTTAKGNTDGNSTIVGPSGPVDIQNQPTIVPATDNTIALNVQPDPITFTDTNVGAFVTDSITVNNFSTNQIIITGIEPSSKYPSNNQAFSADTAFPITIASGATGTIQLRFSPKSAITYVDALLLKIEGEDFGYPFLAAGTGLISPIRDISLEGNSIIDANLSYPDKLVNEEQNLILKIKNNGADPLLDNFSIAAIEIFQTEGNYTIISGGIPGAAELLLAGQTREVVIRFKPLSLGDKLATVRILSTADTGDVDPSGFSYSELSGKGVAGPEPTQKIEFESNFGKYTYSDPQTDTGKIDFGDQIDVKSQVFQKENFILRNIGTSKISISGLRLIYAPFQNPTAFILDFEQYGFSIAAPQFGLGNYLFPDGAIDLEPESELPFTGLWFKPVIVETFEGIVEPILAQGFELSEESVELLPFIGRGKFIPEDEDDNGGGPPRPEPAPEESGCKNKICAIPYLYEYNINEPREI